MSFEIDASMRMSSTLRPLGRPSGPATIARSPAASRALAALVALGTLAGSGLLAPVGPAMAEAQAPYESSVRVSVDSAKVVRIPRSADTVIIGNPAIAEATLQDARTIVLTGVKFGVTNLIVLDEEGDPIIDETVTVGPPVSNTVNLFNGTARDRLACAPDCQETERGRRDTRFLFF